MVGRAHRNRIWMSIRHPMKRRPKISVWKKTIQRHRHTRQSKMWIWCVTSRATGTDKAVVSCHIIRRRISWAPCRHSDHQSMFYYGKSFYSHFLAPFELQLITMIRCVVYFQRVDEAKWKHCCKSIAAMLFKQWKPCCRGTMRCIRYRCQHRRRHFQWNPHSRHCFRQPFLVRRPPIVMPFFSNNSNSTPNDSWPHLIRVPDTYRQSYNQMVIKTNQTVMATDVAVLANHRNDTKICNCSDRCEQGGKSQNPEWKHWNNVLWIAFIGLLWLLKILYLLYHLLLVLPA